MPAYWIAHAKVSDPIEYKKYTDLVPAIVRKYNGTVLARGGKYKLNEGPSDFDRFHRHVVIEFPTYEDAMACFESPEYQKAAEYRRAANVGEVVNVIVEGGDVTPR